jgi:hypothetical protein
MLETIRFHKRDDDLRQGVVTTYVLYECRKGAVSKTGEPIAGSMAGVMRVTWHIPRSELERVGINYINAIDEIEELEGRFKGRKWNPESDTMIDIKLFENHIDLECKQLR